MILSREPTVFRAELRVLNLIYALNTYTVLLGGGGGIPIEQRDGGIQSRSDAAKAEVSQLQTEMKINIPRAVLGEPFISLLSYNK